MGLLRHARTGELRTLAGRTLVGRSAGCALRLEDAKVSSEHAVLAWRSDRWTVRDLGSRNGTALSGRPMAAGVEVPLARGDALRFADDEWVLHDDAPPSPIAVRLATGARVGGDADVLLLPDAESPLVSITPTPTGSWCVYSDDERSDVEDRATVEVGGEWYQLYLPTRADPTLGPGDAVGLCFRVSPDEEQVEVEVTASGRVARLGPRSHHYLLLTLARLRVSQAGRSAADRGWVHRDDLARMLKLDVRTVAVQVHRLRQELGAHEMEGAASLLEVRARTGQLRVGTYRITLR